jgi:hypothetical protein
MSCFYYYNVIFVTTVLNTVVFFCYEEIFISNYAQTCSRHTNANIETQVSVLHFHKTDYLSSEPSCRLPEY